MTVEDVEVQVEKKTMKEELLGTIASLKAAGTDFEKEPPLFRWTYPEEPDIMLQLMINNVPKQVEEPRIILPNA